MVFSCDFLLQFGFHSRKSRKTNASKRAADTSTSQLQDEEELPHVGPEIAETLLIPTQVHPWLRFDQRWVHYAKYARNLFSLLRKEFELSRYVEWEPLEAVGLSQPIRDLLIQRFEFGGNVYEFTEWERIFNIREPVFKELCYEFHSTLILQRDVTSATDANFMKFRLGGEPRFLSLRQLAECLGIYSQAELEYDFFDDYLITGARVQATHEFIEGEFWEQFSDKEFAASLVSYKDMNDVHLRVIHRFITHTIANRRENNEKVTLADIWYLRQIYERNHINFPYCVAHYLDTTAGGLKDKSPIVGGHFVTLLARGLGVNFGIRPTLTQVDLNQRSVGYLIYHAAEAVSKTKKGFIPFQPKQPTEQSQQRGRVRAQQQQGSHQGGFEAPHSAPECIYPAPPSMLDLMQGIQGIQLSTNQIGDNLNEFRNEVNYRLGNMEYRTDWTAGNLRWLAEQQGQQTTFSEPLYSWGTPESHQYPPPVYNHASALEEAQRYHQQHYATSSQQEWNDRDVPSHWSSWPSEEETRKSQEDRSQYRGYWPF